MDAGGVDEERHKQVVGIVFTEQLDQVDEQHAPHHLVTVHVTYVLELRLT